MGSASRMEHETPLPEATDLGASETSDDSDGFPGRIDMRLFRLAARLMELPCLGRDRSWVGGGAGAGVAAGAVGGPVWSLAVVVAGVVVDGGGDGADAADADAAGGAGVLTRVVDVVRLGVVDVVCVGLSTPARLIADAAAELVAEVVVEFEAEDSDEAVAGVEACDDVDDGVATAAGAGAVVAGVEEPLLVVEPLSAEDGGEREWRRRLMRDSERWRADWATAGCADDGE